MSIKFNEISISSRQLIFSLLTYFYGELVIIKIQGAKRVKGVQ